MEIGKWAEIRRLKEVDGLSNRQIACRLRCCSKTVAKVLLMSEPPTGKERERSGSILDPFKEKVDDLIKRYPTLSAVRVHQEIVKCGYQGEMTLIRRYLRQIRPIPCGRVYLECNYEPAEAMQVDYGECGKIRVGQSSRKLYVFVAVLCYSRLIYIEFLLSQRKEEFYRCLVNAFNFIGGMPKRIIFDNLKAAVVDGAGKNARFHPEFLALCGHYLLEPVACARRDPETKGRVEDGVKYVKINALAGYDEHLKSIEDYHRHAIFWRDQVANIRIHASTHRRPIDMFAEERKSLRPLPEKQFNTDIAVPVVAGPMARVIFDCNKYSVPPTFARKPLTLRANDRQVKIFSATTLVAVHARCYEKGKSIMLDEHRQQILQLRRGSHLNQTEAEFDSLCPQAQKFRHELLRRPVKSVVHIRHILKLASIYGKDEVVQAIAKALEFNAIDAAYVENLVQQQCRQKNLPSPTPICPQRKELLDDVAFDAPDPAEYDKIFGL